MREVGKKKILIIRFSSIGDIAWVSPSFRCVKTQVENVEVHYLVKRQFVPLVEANPYIDKIHTLEDNLKATVAKLKPENYDLVFDLHQNLRSNYIKRMLGKPYHSYRKHWFKRFLFTRFQWNLLPSHHIVDEYLATFACLGVTYDGKGMDYFIPEKDEVELDWIPETHRNGYVAYVIGGSYYTKILPFEKMVELCDKINRPIVLVGSKEDAPMGDKVEKFFTKTEDSQPYEEGLRKLNKKTIVWNACGKFNLNQSVSLIQHANYVFGHDTGLTHIASAFKKITYSIWGSTVPVLFRPFETKFYVLQNENLKCRPCSKSGRKKCPKGHFKCMREMPLDFYLPE